MIYLYTDGASSGNPGPGGFCAILQQGQHEKVIAKGFRKTTNNRMELLAVIEGLKALKRKGLEVTIVSDSKYVVDTIEKGWLKNWMRTDFKGKKNKDLWLDYFQVSQGQQIKMQWIKGHANHPQNTRCDQLAVQASKSAALEIDVNYENESA
jgi:ribonuclease HI